MGTVFFLLTSKKNYKITNNSFLVSPVVQCQSKSNAFAQLTILSSKNVLKTFVLVMGTFYMSSFLNVSGTFFKVSIDVPETFFQLKFHELLSSLGSVVPESSVES